VPFYRLAKCYKKRKLGFAMLWKENYFVMNLINDSKASAYTIKSFGASNTPFHLTDPVGDMQKLMLRPFVQPCCRGFNISKNGGKRIFAYCGRKIK